MGVNYVLQKPFDMAETYKETSPATPMFFVLFPGVDPTPWVESLARTLDITTENGEHSSRPITKRLDLFRGYEPLHVVGVLSEARYTITEV